VCLANLRPQKDHLTLLLAFKEVVNLFPDWTLHCVGKSFNDDYSKLITDSITELNLSKNVFLYGTKPDIFNILKQCEIGVLSSKSEGLPISLLEYGLAKLAVIATRVGECETIISDKINGLLVHSVSVEALKNAFIFYIENETLRHEFANLYHTHIQKEYSSKGQISTIINVYKMHL
jgi:glycosyltransferase involved in cell wall biosynthesis